MKERRYKKRACFMRKNRLLGRYENFNTWRSGILTHNRFDECGLFFHFSFQWIFRRSNQRRMDELWRLRDRVSNRKSSFQSSGKLEHFIWKQSKDCFLHKKIFLPKISYMMHLKIRLQFWPHSFSIIKWYVDHRSEINFVFSKLQNFPFRRECMPRKWENLQSREEGRRRDHW